VKYSDATLMAYADGELDAATRAEIEAAIARDPELARAVARHRALAARVRQAYERELEEPVPDRLAALAEGPAAARVDELTARRAGRRIGAGRWRLPAWTALAATVLVGLFMTVRVMRGPGAPYAEVDGVLVARGELDAALTNELASRPASTGVSIGISFRDRDGGYCRTFRLQQEKPVAGLACRSGGTWQLHALAEAAALDGEVRTASSMPLAVLQAVDSMIAGEPLDAASESAARDADWRDARDVAE
jgi:anti-sigma factor RsiW